MLSDITTQICAAGVKRFAFVYQGEVVLSLDDVEYHLGPGDSAVIPAGVNRRWRNDTPMAVEILIVSARPVS
jgi:quercetin dioxygenase-like cupin family protein